MIKWLSASRLKNAAQCEPTPLTNDPLAVITGINNLDGKCQIYAVTRVNPLFKEERNQGEKREGATLDDNSDENADQRLSPRKSISSGYESRCNSSSESSSCTECEGNGVKKTGCPPKREKRLTKQAKRRSSDCDASDSGTFRSIVSGQDPGGKASAGASPTNGKRRSKKYKNGSPPGSSNLSPIPEGKIDCSIPPPIWPRFGTDASEAALDTQVPAGMSFHDGTTNPLNFMYKYNEKYPKCCNDSSRSQWNYFDEKGHLSGAISVKTEYERNWIECCSSQCNDNFLSKSPGSNGKGRTFRSAMESVSKERNQLTHDVLRDLANLISYAMKRKNVLSVEEILMTLSESIQKSLDMLTRTDVEESLRQLRGNAANDDGNPYSLNISRDETYSSGSEGKNSSTSSVCKDYSSSNSSNAEKNNVYGIASVEIFHPDAVYGPFPTKKVDPKCSEEAAGGANRRLTDSSNASLIHHQRDCSSSSTESGFGFSESSPTPSSDCSSNERRRGVPHPSFLYDSIYGVPKGMRNAVARDSQNRTSDSFKNSSARDCGSSAFVKLISAKRKISSASKADEMGPLTVEESGKSSLLPGAGTVKVDNLLKKVEHPYYIAMGRPDFTLDLPQAEKLVKKLSSSKRRRCWCRLMTSLLGLGFFLFSVMMVSLIVTKGKRLFGAL